jgi:N-acetylmuramoyl-L-alanine amidase
VEILKKGRVLILNLKDVIDVKTYKLYSPPRLVFDLLEITKDKESTSLPQRADEPGTDKHESTQPPAGPLSGFFQGSKPQIPEDAGVKKRELKTVVLDAGHGGYDYGIVLNGANEKEAGLNLAKDIRYRLARKGLKTFITRGADQYVSLYDRIVFANGKKPDLFISLHSRSSSTQSFAIYVAEVGDQNVDALTELYSLSSRQNRHIDDSRRAAISLGEAIRSELKAAVVLRKLPLPILESIDAPAVMIEYPSSAPYYSDKKMRERLVSAILKGLENYEK